MNRKAIVGTLVIGVAAMMILSIMPAMATSAGGIIVSVNPSEKHGMIERTDDGSHNLYQFRIPQDVVGDSLIQEGTSAEFDIDPENSRHATNVKTCPPFCGGGTAL